MKALIIPIMGWVSRMSGGAPPKLPWGLDQWIYALPFLPVLWPVTGLWSLAGYGMAVLGKRTGHGRGASVGEPMEPGTEPEKMEFLIRWLQPKIPNFYYKLLILWMTHILLVSGTVVAFAATGHWPQAVCAFLMSFNKPAAYAIGWEVHPTGRGGGWKYTREATQVGELFTGIFDGIILTILWMSV